MNMHSKWEHLLCWRSDEIAEPHRRESSAPEAGEENLFTNMSVILARRKRTMESKE